MEDFILPFNNLFKRSICSNWLTIGLALYLSCFLNNQFWYQIIKIQTELSLDKWIFLGTIFIIVTLLQIIIIFLIMWGKFSKYIATALIICTVFADYYSQFYGIHFNTNMIKNIFSTSYLETREFIMPSVLVHYIKFGLLPTVAIFYINIPKINFFKDILWKFKIIIICVAIASVLILSQIKQIISIMRNHQTIRHVVLPTSYLIATTKVLIEYTEDINTTIKEIDQYATRNISIHHKPKLVVLVIGETVRSQNWSLSGYHRQTTPNISKLPIINFPYTHTCGTNTDISVPCMFSSLGRKNYDEKKIKSTESILHLLNRLHIDVTWIDNQSGCKGVCKNLKNYQANIFDTNSKFCTKSNNCLDEVLIDGLKKNIKNIAEDQIIVLHQLGNHGPAYYARYPNEFEIFKPICKSADLTKCTKQEIINAYDNAILYTDYVLYKLILELETIKNRDVFFIYVSDHGESLGEGNLYLHGLPYHIAPSYQTNVPMLFWHSKRFPINHECLLKKATQPSQHDNLYHTLLGLFNVSSITYNKSYDLGSDCYTEHS